jgi:hypothetical protein
MKIKLLLTPLFLLIACFGFAQDSLQRKANHYIGLQANQLFRQILNLSNSNAAISNPYLLVYSVNSSSHGHGLNLSVGYVYNQVNDGDAFGKRETTIDNLNFRAGYEKKSNLGRKWVVSWGFDLIFDKLSNNTKNTNTQGGPSFTFETTTKTEAWGVGPRFTLNYQVTDKILLGTESTYYFKTGSNSSKFEPSTEPQPDEEEFKQFQLTAPVAIYLIIKF